MITVNDFIERANPDHGDAAEIRRAIVKSILETNRLLSAREVAYEYYRTQAVSDRVVQEVVIRDERVTDQEIMEEMPLVFPEEDLGRVGDFRYVLGGPSDVDRLHLTKEEFKLLWLKDDGTCVTDWRPVDSLTFPQADLETVDGVVRTHIIATNGEGSENSRGNSEV